MFPMGLAECLVEQKGYWVAWAIATIVLVSIRAQS